MLISRLQWSGLIVLAMVITMAVVFHSVQANKEFQTKVDRIKSEGVKLEQLHLKEESARTAQQKAADDARNAEIQKQIDDLKQRVDAKKQSTLAKAVTSQVAQAATVPVSTGSDSDAKLWIYNHESGNNPARYNSIGCLGLGQACPASKLLAVCPVITDYACQDAWFTSYAVSRYGGWLQAKAAWLSKGWW